MKKYITLLLLSIAIIQTQAQNIGINSDGSTPNSSAMLDINVSGLSTKKGLLIPRVTEAQKTAMNPLPEAAQGLVVYQTDGVEGFYYNTSTSVVPSWKFMLPATGNSGGWGLSGNSGTTAGTNFIGTSDANALVLKTNGTERMRFLSNGNTGIGTSIPSYDLEIRGDNGFVYTKKSKANYSFPSSTGNLSLDGNNNTYCPGSGIYTVIIHKITGPEFFISNTGAIRGGVFKDSAAFSSSLAIASTAFGYDALASGKYSFSAGVGTHASGDNSVAMGAFSTASGVSSFACQEGTASGLNSIAFYGTAADTLSIAIGNSTVNKAYGVALGYGNTVDSRYGICIGTNVSSKSKNAITIGSSTRVNPTCPYSKGIANTVENSLMIGFNSDTATFFVGSSAGAGTTGNVGIGTIFPSAKLEIAGQIKITGGNPGAGKVLQSDASGLASWQTLPTTGWELTGNSGTSVSTNFIGTTDAVSMAFKTSNTERMRLLSTGNFGINTTTPDNILDVNGKISVTQTFNDEMVIINGSIWQHGMGNQSFGIGGDYFIMASKEGSNESAGIFGDGNNVTLWSAGDAAPGQPAALLYILDEDNFDNADTDPYNNSALKAYVTTAGVWQVSDKNKKQNLNKMENAIAKINRLSGYTYEYKLSTNEIKKNQIPEKSGGIIAQELELVLPEAVQTNDKGEKFVNYSAITPLLIEGIKEQEETLKEKQLEINLIKEKMQQQQLMLEQLMKEIELLKK